ncbi:MAG: sulfurtransferase [Euzebyales bacterium]|nr:sulfurtransferase [Euzebyales bacterium]
MISERTPAAVVESLRGDDPPLLVDVREHWERGLAAIPCSLHLPMGEIPTRLTELPRDRELVLYCHHGARSRQVAHFLSLHGFDRLSNLDGGIDAWSQRVDPSIPTY